MAEMTQKYRNALISLRRHLHKFPETAHNEEQTANYITEFLEQFEPDKIIRGIGGYGLAAVYQGDEDGPTVMVRCELDGLPIREENSLDYKSLHEGLAHLCGHDGHMTIVSGLAPMLFTSRPKKGSVVLLYQPAEETGEGARKVLEDDKLQDIKPDYVFALHNLPGYSTSTVVLKKGVFASASKGLIIKLEGASSHAGHPENGNNPAVAASMILQSVMSLPQRKVALHESALITPIHLRVGSAAFGTSPGDGEMMFTLRAHSNETMETLEKSILHEVRSIAAAHQLSFEYKWTEPFEVVNNHDKSVDLIEQCAKNIGLDIMHKEIPFPWSEDFGVFTNAYDGALFGLGSGVNAAQLHHPNYKFPDEIIETGTLLFYQIISELLGT